MTFYRKIKILQKNLKGKERMHKWSTYALDLFLFLLEGNEKNVKMMYVMTSPKKQKSQKAKKKHTHTHPIPVIKLLVASLERSRQDLSLDRRALRAVQGLCFRENRVNTTRV